MSVNNNVPTDKNENNFIIFFFHRFEAVQLPLLYVSIALRSSH